MFIYTHVYVWICTHFKGLNYWNVNQHNASLEKYCLETRKLDPSTHLKPKSSAMWLASTLHPTHPQPQSNTFMAMTVCRRPVPFWEPGLLLRLTMAWGKLAAGRLEWVPKFVGSGVQSVCHFTSLRYLRLLLVRKSNGIRLSNIVILVINLETSRFL